MNVSRAVLLLGIIAAALIVAGFAVHYWPAGLVAAGVIFGVTAVLEHKMGVNR